MTGRRDRLARLLAVRTVALHASSRDLGAAIGSTAAIATLARRIGELQVELRPVMAASSGQQLKAAAATRSGLDLAAGRQQLRLDAASEQQAIAASAVHRDRAAADAVERALERRGAGETEAAIRPPPRARWSAIHRFAGCSRRCGR